MPPPEVRAEGKHAQKDKNLSRIVNSPHPPPEYREGSHIISNPVVRLSPFFPSLSDFPRLPLRLLAAT